MQFLRNNHDYDARLSRVRYTDRGILFASRPSLTGIQQFDVLEGCAIYAWTAYGNGTNCPLERDSHVTIELSATMV